MPASRRYDVVLCGFAAVTAVEVDGAGQPVNPALFPTAWPCRSRRWPRATARCSGCSVASPRPRTADVGERVFALLDAAQIELATKEAVHRVVTEHDPARAVAALTALDLPRPLFTAVVELLLADISGT